MDRKPKKKRKILYFLHRAAAALSVVFAGLCLTVSVQLPARVFTDSAPAVSLRTVLPVELSGGGDTAQAKLFGVLPVGRVRVAVLPVDRVIPGGDAVAVRLCADGAVVVGYTDSDRDNPARAAGLKPGDVIVEVNGQPVASAEDLNRCLRGAKPPLRLTWYRGEEPMRSSASPRQDGAALGIFVRDSTAGIGTLTFVVPETGAFGSLGHGITDPDTETLFRLGQGDLFPAQITGVRKGGKGVPGELQGAFVSPRAGDVTENRITGLYGVTDPALWEDRAALPVATKEQVREGDAVIRCTVDGDGVKEFSVRIEHIYRAFSGPTKNMLIRVTDPALLEISGGIVQGMSGSPILQDGKIVGAVTHVLINDPTRGYGIFIENMLDGAERSSERPAA